MSFENYPGSTSFTKTNETASNKNNSARNILTAGLLFALLSSWGYIIFDKGKTKETIGQKESLLATSNLQTAQLQKELDDVALRYDDLKTANNKKDSTITRRDKEIAEKKTKIQQLLNKANASQGELTEAKKLISDLRGDISGYKQQIVLLRAEKNMLMNEKTVAITQRDKLQKDYDSTQLVVNEKEAAIKDKDNAIDIGGTLHASNISIAGINERRNGKEKTTTKAKKVDKLRVSFDIDENRIAKSGPKQIYVCITSPDGNPIALQTGGTFNERNGAEKWYTQKLSINYEQNKRQTLSFDWKPTDNFNTGDYKIEVYNNGFKIGESTKTLKKSGLF
jgi:hypothetical protein